MLTILSPVHNVCLQMVWLIPDTQHELFWDNGMCADTSRGAAIREQINRALKGALDAAQQKVPFLP